MIYKIENKTPKKWNDKDFVEAELVDEKGERFKVSAWAGEFNGIEAWEGELAKNDKGYWKLVSTKRAFVAKEKTAQIEKSMEKKAENIEKAQENRAEGVRISATMRDAVQCAIVAFGKDPTRLNTLEEEIIYWRKWLWKHWDDPITDAIYPD